MEAYKLFERSYGMPRTLVHGRPITGGSRTRMYFLDEYVVAEQGTPGFCAFPTREKALEYLPRFRVRADKLILCKVEMENQLSNPTSSRYNHYRNMIIRSNDWFEALREHGKE